MIVFSVTVVVLLIGVILLIPLGFRSGDKPGDAAVIGVASRARPRRVEVTVRNSGAVPLLVGVVLRGRGLRGLWLVGGTRVRLRRRTTAPELLPSRLATVGVIDPGEEAMFGVPVGSAFGSRGELMVVMGQPGRLRTIHRVVVLPALDAREPGSGGRAIRVTDVTSLAGP